MIQASDIKAMIEAALPGATVMVEDLTGTFDHYKVRVITDAFAGKMLVKRHQMINEILKEPLKGPIHALTMETLTPAEWQQKQSGQNSQSQSIVEVHGVHSQRRKIYDHSGSD